MVVYRIQKGFEIKEGFKKDLEEKFYSNKAVAIKEARRIYKEGYFGGTTVIRVDLGKVDKSKVLQILNGHGYLEGDSHLVWWDPYIDDPDYQTRS